MRQLNTLLGSLILLVLPFNAHAVDSNTCAHDETTFRCVQYVKNYDADTITFDIPGQHPLFGKNISIRVRGVDTPELRTKDACEKRLSKKAKVKVKAMLEVAKRIDLKNIERGKYFRIVADVIVDGKNLSDMLLENKFAYKYDGGTKRKVNWCTFQRVPASAENK